MKGKWNMLRLYGIISKWEFLRDKYKKYLCSLYSVIRIQKNILAFWHITLKCEEVKDDQSIDI